MNQRNTLLSGAVMGCVAVILGAFGAHAFKTILATTGRLDTYELAVQYQMYHALAMLFVGALMNQFSSKMLSYSSLFFMLGILFFSGSLYVLCFTGEKMLGAVTPIGGVLFILGWVLLLLGILKK
jgi:uncharacterized membrane protein YgdD (TMEM256/DUF423 family)